VELSDDDLSAEVLTGEDLTGETMVEGSSRPATPQRGGSRFADEDDLAAGAMLGSLYRVVRRIGEGGMGTVYEVEHTRMRKRFAAKVLRRELSTREHIQRLEREAITAGSIEHPNILRIVNLDETAGGRVFLVSELLEGHDASRLVQEGPVPLEVAFRLVLSIASALARTHREGIIHRDLKPENVFLHRQDGDVVVKVLDFGVSKADEGEEGIRLTEAGAVIGTPAYMSPESTEGRADLDHRADVYSLGVILYELATGELPFSGSSAIEVMIKHVNDPVRPPSLRNPDVPPEIDAICLRAMAKAPDERYQSMDAFAEAIRALAQHLGLGHASIPMLPAGDPVGLRSKTPGPVAITSVQRHDSRGKLWLVAAAVVAVLGLAGTLYLGTRAGPSPPPRPAAQPTRGAQLAAPAAAAATASAPAPNPAVVELDLATSPPGAEVLQGDESLGVTPVKVVQPRSTDELELTFRLDGYKTESRSLMPDKSQSLLLEMKRKAKSRKKRGSPKGPKILGTR